MSLCNIYEWQISKSVKLSDTYEVLIQMTPDSEFVTLPECTDVTLPNYKYKEEIYRYGNTEKLFIIPDYSGLEDLSLQFVENYRDNLDEYSKLRIQDLVNICLNKLYTQYTDNNIKNLKFVGYRLTDTIHQIIIRLYKNTFDKALIDYVFTDLKLTDYTAYELNYSTADLLKWTLKFSYQGYYVVDSPDDEPLEKIDEAAYWEKLRAKQKAEEEEKIRLAKMAAQKREEAIRNKKKAKDAHDAAMEKADQELEELYEQRDQLAEEQRDLYNEEYWSDDKKVKKARDAYLAANGKKLENEQKLKDRKEEIAQNERKKVEEMEKTLEEKRNSADANPEEIAKLEAELEKAKGSLESNIKKKQEKDKKVKELTAAVKRAETAEEKARANFDDVVGKSKAGQENKDRRDEINERLYGNSEEGIIGLEQQITNAEAKKKAMEREYEKQVSEMDKEIAEWEARVPEGTKVKSEHAIESEEEERNHHERANQKTSIWASDTTEQVEESEDPKTSFDETAFNDAMIKYDAEVEASYEKDFTRRVIKEGKERRLGEQIQSETGVENVLGEITKIPELEELELDEDNEPAPKQNTEIKTETEIEAPDLAPQKLELKTKQREVNTITLNEADIDKYVPLLLRPFARSYFNDYKNENNTITLPADEKLLLENVPKMLWGTAKEIYDKYMEDHPSGGK